jgi:hypothetical protein
MITFSARQNWVLAVAVVLASLILGVSFGGRTAAQRVEPPVSVGRYQIRHANDTSQVVVIDTATGQCWVKVQLGDWKDLGSPTRK